MHHLAATSSDVRHRRRQLRGLREGGHEIVGVNLRSADVIADLSSPEGPLHPRPPGRWCSNSSAVGTRLTTRAGAGRLPDRAGAGLGAGGPRRARAPPCWQASMTAEPRAGLRRHASRILRHRAVLRRVPPGGRRGGHRLPDARHAAFPSTASARPRGPLTAASTRSRPRADAVAWPATCRPEPTVGAQCGGINSFQGPADSGLIRRTGLFISHSRTASPGERDRRSQHTSNPYRRVGSRRTPSGPGRAEARVRGRCGSSCALLAAPARPSPGSAVGGLQDRGPGPVALRSALNAHLQQVHAFLQGSIGVSRGAWLGRAGGTVVTR